MLKIDDQRLIAWDGRFFWTGLLLLLIGAAVPVISYFGNPKIYSDLAALNYLVSFSVVVGAIGSFVMIRRDYVEIDKRKSLIRISKWPWKWPVETYALEKSTHIFIEKRVNLSGPPYNAFRPRRYYVSIVGNQFSTSIFSGETHRSASDFSLRLSKFLEIEVIDRSAISSFPNGWS